MLLTHFNDTSSFVPPAQRGRRGAELFLKSDGKTESIYPEDGEGSKRAMVIVLSGA
jgi:hypothetical protein